MSLKAEIQADIAEAFDSDLADAVTDFTGTREIPGGYDPVSGTTPTTITTYTGRGVFGSFKAEELNQHIVSTDEKLYGILQNELLVNDEQGRPTSAPATPEANDLINGKRVVAVMRDPASATWSVALRKT